MDRVSSRVVAAFGNVHIGGSGGGVAANVGGHGSWWELAGRESASLARTWRAVHAGARVAAEVGLAFTRAEDQSDGSAGGLRWYGGEKLTDGFFAGVGVEGDDAGSDAGMFAVLRVWDMRLVLVDRGGVALASLELADRRVEEAAGWAVDRTMNILDVGVRCATPMIGGGGFVVDGDAGGDDADVFAGGAFGEPDQLASAEVLRVLWNTSVILAGLRGVFADGSGNRAVCRVLDGMTFGARFEVGGGRGGEGRRFEVGFDPYGGGVGGGAVEVGGVGGWFVRRCGVGDGGDDAASVLRLGFSEVGRLEGPVLQAERVIGFVAESLETLFG